jgi:hypothetical protein
VVLTNPKEQHRLDQRGPFPPLKFTTAERRKVLTLSFLATSSIRIANALAQPIPGKALNRILSISLSFFSSFQPKSERPASQEERRERSQEGLLDLRERKSSQRREPWGYRRKEIGSAKCFDKKGGKRGGGREEGDMTNILMRIHCEKQFGEGERC